MRLEAVIVVCRPVSGKPDGDPWRTGRPRFCRECQQTEHVSPTLEGSQVRAETVPQRGSGAARACGRAPIACSSSSTDGASGTAFAWVQRPHFEIQVTPACGSRRLLTYLCSHRRFRPYIRRPHYRHHRRPPSAFLNHPGPSWLAGRSTANRNVLLASRRGSIRSTTTPQFYWNSWVRLPSVTATGRWRERGTMGRLPTGRQAAGELGWSERAGSRISGSPYDDNLYRAPRQPSAAVPIARAETAHHLCVAGRARAPATRG